MDETLRSMPRDTERENVILEAARQRYGDALFTYVPDRDPRPYTMTLEQAMEVCGPMIVLEPLENLWPLLDRWRATAQKLDTLPKEVKDASLALGHSAVLRAKGTE